MDISGISSMYTDLYASAADQSAAKLEKKMNGTDFSASSTEELLDACKQFEAYFVEQMFKEMLKTVPASQETSNYASSITDYYKDQMVQNLAEDTAKQNSLGLAQMLYEQMKRNYGIADIPQVEPADESLVADSGQEAQPTVE